MKATHALIVLESALLCLVALPPANARSYATKPLHFIVPYSPGGGADFMSRAVQPKLTQILGQQVVIDNRPGAGGNIGAEIAAHSSADGYTIFMGTANFSMAVSLFNKLQFDPIRDFTPISLLAESPSILAVNPSLSAHSVKDLIALAKKTPGKINYASDGGGPLLLFVELFKTMAKVNLTNIPYKSTGPALTSVIAGETSVVMAPAAAVIPHAESGRLRALAITSAKRLAAMPNLPTVAESGVPGFEATQWYGILAPAGTPGPIIAELNRACVRAMAMQDMRDLLAKRASVAVGSTPGEFAKFLKGDIEKWAVAAKYSGLRRR